jgi:hypothetical protein
MAPPRDHLSHIAAVVSMALVNAHGSSGYAGCHHRESRPPRLKKCEPDRILH